MGRTGIFAIPKISEIPILKLHRHKEKVSFRSELYGNQNMLS